MTDNPFASLFGQPSGDDFPEGTPEFVKDLLLQQAREQAIEASARQFVQAILVCMKQEGVNLEASIEMGRTLVAKDAEIGTYDLAQAEMATQAFERGAIMARTALAEAKALVQADRTGRKTPRPYNEKRHLEERARQRDEERIAKAAFEQFTQRFGLDGEGN